jgi:hypothetical protein
MANVDNMCEKLKLQSLNVLHLSWP